MNFDHPPADPLDAFRMWFVDAQATELPNSNAMTLATVDPDGRPSARIVLLKSIDQRGAVFFTNRLARKGRALEANPYAMLLFHWDPLDRQVRIEGPVELVSDEESDAYFATRPRASQIGAWASRQSEPAASRAELDAAVAETEARFTAPDGSPLPVPRPPHWGGYLVKPEQWEFWQGRKHRLHDRVLYTLMEDKSWRIQRLYP